MYILDDLADVPKPTDNDVDYSSRTTTSREHDTDP